MKAKITEQITLPNEVTARLENGKITIQGPKGQLQRTVNAAQITLEIKGNTITIACEVATKRHKRSIYTTQSHIKNMIKGVQQPYTYKLKICSGHFPMNVSMTGNKLIVKNFLGEKNPRTLTLKEGATVKITGDQIVVESPDKEKAGQVASDIELLTAKKNRDLRIFQDGIYVTEKASKPVGGKQ